MEQMTAIEIVRAVGGGLIKGNPDIPVTDIATDSRQCKKGDLYVPIIGERVDGHRFITGAITLGASAVFTSEHTAEEAEKEADPTADTAWIAVEDTKAALQRLGRYCRDRLDIPFVGVTGSVGKTSTRAMIATALSAGKKTFQTAGNANSQVGVPITLSRVSTDFEAAVIELGMSEPGEMTRIASIAGLDIAVMTNIGISHIEQLGSQANILREKLHITDGLKENGCLIFNGDDPYLSGRGEEAVPEREECLKLHPVKYYGLEEGNDYRGTDVRVIGDKTSFVLEAGGRRIPVVLPVIGTHHVRNALAALACADALRISLEDAAKALADFSGVAHRQEILTLSRWGVTVIDDSYNASPDSMKAALTTLKLMHTDGRKIAVLADMFELGADTRKYHREVGIAAGETAPDMLITVGPLAREIAKGAALVDPQAAIRSFDDKEQAAAWLEGQIREGDLILFKGSNGMRLFEIVENWKKQL